LKLKLSEMANIAEVIGAVAIIVSLIYVGIEVNDSTRAVRSATANETAAAISAWYRDVGGNQQAASVIQAGMSNPDSLSPDEALQFVYLIHGLMHEYQAAYYLAREGTLDSAIQESITNTLSGTREMPGFNMYWQQRRDLFQPDFRAYVDEIAATGTTNTNLEQLYQRN
jgi:hypothetical protein